jgi:hypothetical protein
MSNGIFGSVRPANLDINNDVEIFYSYRPSRGETSSDFEDGFQTLTASEVLKICKNTNNAINGLYTLRLPLNKFNRKGFYTIFIRPKEIETEIMDVSVLATYPDVKGVVFRLNNDLPADLTGYRIEFEDGTSRLIKSCNPCEPVIVNSGDGYPKTTRYNLNVLDSRLVFCTVTPSSSPTFNTNASPYIGEPGVLVKLINTKFSPKMLEIEMVTHDMDTLSYMLEGDQVNDRDNAIITTYNDKKEIYHQADYYTLKDKLGNPLYNIRKKRNIIDVEQEYENIIDNE